MYDAANNGSSFISNCLSQAMKLLKINTMSLFMFVLFEGLILILWAIATVIPGFCVFDNPNNLSGLSTVTYTSAGWWIALEIFFWGCGLISPFFSLVYDADNGRYEKGIAPALGKCSSR
jgi:hypothetical protein